MMRYRVTLPIEFAHKGRRIARSFTLVVGRSEFIQRVYSALTHADKLTPADELYDRAVALAGVPGTCKILELQFEVSD